MTVQVLREGKEPGHIGQTLDVVVTSALQTPAGRMIFTRSREDAPAPAPAGHDA